MKILRNLLMMAVLATAASVSQAGTARVESPAVYCIYHECNYFGTGYCSGICTQCVWNWFSSSTCQYPTQ